MMSSDRLLIRQMTMDDIERVAQIEAANHHAPWPIEVFFDCLRVGYDCLVLEKNKTVIGYTILLKVLDEAHLLNITIDKTVQHQGYGHYFLSYLMDVACQQNMKYIFLEVRVSNIVARKLYEKLGFLKTGVRKEYYDAKAGREDAILYTLFLNKTNEVND
jgi:[ribosomal protein S18]-alanine N-acetyltransferase